MTGAYLHINKENPDQGMLENILLQQHFLRHTSQDTHLSVGVQKITTYHWGPERTHFAYLSHMEQRPPTSSVWWEAPHTPVLRAWYRCTILEEEQNSPTSLENPRYQDQQQKPQPSSSSHQPESDLPHPNGLAEEECLFWGTETLVLSVLL